MKASVVLDPNRLACTCGTNRPSEVVHPPRWKKAKAYKAKCPACGKTSSSTFHLEMVDNVWNDMIRAEIAARSDGPAHEDAVPVWPPIAGYYAIRLVKDGPLVPVRIWHGLAEIDGETQDRGEDWRVEIDGRTDRVEKDKETGATCSVPLEITRAWPYCLKHPIEEWRYRYRIKHGEWAREHAPAHPHANPREKIDVRQMEPIF
ncbi:MAG: hypothetical protein K9G48_12775 [Reyranella sp.]|nr:hypothetical protein [Reyranella sp.]